MGLVTFHFLLLELYYFNTAPVKVRGEKKFSVLIRKGQDVYKTKPMWEFL